MLRSTPLIVFRWLFGARSAETTSPIAQARPGHCSPVLLSRCAWAEPRCPLPSLVRHHSRGPRRESGSMSGGVEHGGAVSKETVARAVFSALLFLRG